MDFSVANADPKLASRSRCPLRLPPSWSRIESGAVGEIVRPLDPSPWWAASTARAVLKEFELR